jgi:hypothetical protein
MPVNTGPPWSLPSPTLPEAPDGPGDMGEIVAAVHAALGRAYPCLSTGRPTPTEGLLIYETDTDTLLLSTDGVGYSAIWRPATAPSVDASVLTASANFTEASQSFYNTGGVVHFTCSITRLNSALTAGSTGNISNVQMATVDAGWRPPAGNWIIYGGGATGQMAMGYVSDAGVMAVGSLPPGVDWAVSGAITFGGSYPQGN